MKVLLSGYGRMGREVEAILLGRGHTIAARVDPASPDADADRLSPELMQKADMAIDFSHPSAVWGNIQTFLNARLPAVIGTTGWEDKKPEAAALCAEKKTALLWGYNFSVGAHLFFAVIAEAARLVSVLDDYDVALWETHHNKKADSPSGTALTAAERLLAHLPKKKRLLVNASEGVIDPEVLHIGSLRVGSEPGLHEAVFDSLFDTVTVRHHARTRTGFAKGSVLAAEWLQGKTGFFSVDDVFRERFHKES